MNGYEVAVAALDVVIPILLVTLAALVIAYVVIDERDRRGEQSDDYGYTDDDNVT